MSHIRAGQHWDAPATVYIPESAPSAALVLSYPVMYESHTRGTQVLLLFFRILAKERRDRC